jgi:hypothetical protein
MGFYHQGGEDDKERLKAECLLKTSCCKQKRTEHSAPTILWKLVFALLCRGIIYYALVLTSSNIRAEQSSALH